MIFRGTTRQRGIDRINEWTLFPTLLIVFFLLPELSLNEKARADGKQRAQGNTGAQLAQEAEALEQGKPIKRELAAGQSHSYQITLAEGDYLSVKVEQRGIDVTVKVLGPDGQQILESDAEPRKQGEERASLVAEMAGNYRFSLRSAERAVPTGRYEIGVAELRAATEADLQLYKAQKLDAKAVRLYKAGKYDEALPPAEHSLEICTSILGPEHLDVVQSLYTLGMIQYAKGNIEKAEQLYQHSLAIREKALGSEHPLVARSIHFIANIYVYKGDYAKAEQLYQRALDILERTLGTEHHLVAMTLTNLALTYRDKGEYAKAEQLYQRDLAIKERALGAEHLLVATSLHNLAIVCDDKGDYATAEQLFSRSLAIAEKSLGPEHPQVAAAHNSLGIINKVRGNYEKAEQFFQRALAIWEKTLEPGHAHVMRALNNLADLYHEKGDFAKAGQLYQRAFALGEKTLGPNHPDVATSLDNLGILHRDNGEFAKAEWLFRRALEIRKKALGPEHRLVAQSLGSLAILHRVKGEYAKSEQFHLRALAIMEKKLGPTHHEVVEPLHNLAYLYCAKGDYPKAEPLYRRALAIDEKNYGPEYPRIALTLNNLSALFAAKAEIAQAISYQARAIEVSERSISYNLRTGSERQKLAYLATFSARSNQTISLHVRYAPSDQTAARLAATTILQRKGRTLDAMSDSLAVLRQRFNPQDRAELDRLNDITASLASLVLGVPKNITPVEHQEKIKSLEEKKETLEAEISRRSAVFRAQAQPITLTAVQAAMPVDAVLLEFASYRPFDASAIGSDSEFGEPRYVAYLLRRDGKIKWRELGDVKAINDAIAAFRPALADPKRRDVKRLARAVDEKVMRPLRALLGEARQIFVSPDGDLNLIPFEALVDEQERYLIERYSFNYLTSGRDLLRLLVERESKSAPLVIADPVFGARDQLAKADLLQRRPARRRLRKSVTTGSDLSSVYFAPLLGTKLEAKEIKSLFPEAEVLLGEQATEASLKRAVAPRILHIATHGFFLEDRPIKIEGTRGVRLMREDGDLRGLSANVKIENPLLRSGLALAGANRRTGGEDDDSILTALEATGLNLWGTQLVVLSACDTGVGVVRTGEGVYGLRRALVLAGSETQVMSLWPVRDYATQRLMKAFYAGLKQGQGRGEALRNVKLMTMRQRGTEHPFYWAGFIQSGNWTELGDKR
jgi:CHAT domain-containing protein/Tfp pilus assembly protein PilF